MTEPLAEFVDYAGLRRALNACREHRDLSFERLDEIAGAPAGYFSKLLGPRAIRRIGLQSLGWALGGLGIKAVLISDPESLARVEGRFLARDEAHLAAVLNGAVHFTMNRGFLRKNGAKGGTNSRKNMGKRKKRQLAKKAADARWDKHRRLQLKLAERRARLKAKEVAE